MRVMVAKTFSAIVEGLSYVEPVIFPGHFFTGLPEAIEIAKEKHLEVLVTQVFGTGVKITHHEKHFDMEAWRLSGMGPTFKTAKLVMDNRDAARESKLAEKFLVSGAPNVLVNLTCETTPFPAGPALIQALRAALPWVNFLNLGGVKAERLQDLLGLYDRAVCLITGDTSTLHLARSNPVPVIALCADGWRGSSGVNANTFFRCNYSQVWHHLDTITEIVKRSAKWPRQMESTLPKPDNTARPKSSYVKRKPINTKAFQFYHGIGDCCNAATLFKCLTVNTGMKFAVQCSDFMKPIFRAASIETVDFAALENRWLHPRYRGAISPPWVDNKTAHNSPVPMTSDLWQRLIETEVRMPSIATIDLPRPITVLHSKGATSGHWKNLPGNVETKLLDYYAEREGTLVWLSGEPCHHRIRPMRPSTIAELYDLLSMADLVIGVDSGPLHLTRMTNTPAIGCWFGMHPTAFALPCPRIRHLCFADHPFVNEYGSSQRYIESLQERRDLFNLLPVKQVTANLIIEHAEEIYERRETIPG